jgi:hypothetical protein
VIRRAEEEPSLLKSHDGFLSIRSQQKAIVLPLMTPIMPRPVIAKGNFAPRFYEELVGRAVHPAIGDSSRPAPRLITFREEACHGISRLNPASARGGHRVVRLLDVS